MAISTRKRNLIASDYKTGAYSLNALAKKHKVSVNTCKKICTNLSHENAELVEILTLSESAKKSTKSEQDLKAVLSVVESRLKVHETTHNILDAIQGLITKGKAQKVVTENTGDGTSQATVVEYDLQPEHYEKIINAVDKASITLGVNQRHAKNDVNYNQQNNNEIVGYGVKTIEDKSNLKVEFV